MAREKGTKLVECPDCHKRAAILPEAVVKCANCGTKLTVAKHGTAKAPASEKKDSKKKAPAKKPSKK